MSPRAANKHPHECGGCVSLRRTDSRRGEAEAGAAAGIGSGAALAPVRALKGTGFPSRDLSGTRRDGANT